MSNWPILDGSRPSCSYNPYTYFPEQAQQMPAPQPGPSSAPPEPHVFQAPDPPRQIPKMESPRELRNKAEKQRRDNLTQSIKRLATLVPPVVASRKKVDKTSVLRLTAHYLRSHLHVFGKTTLVKHNFSKSFTETIMKTMKGFLITSTYKGLLVVVSPNIQEYLGYTEAELLGQNLYSIIHPDDHERLKQNLFPRCCKLTTNGELFLSKEDNNAEKVADALKNEKRAFVIRFKKQRQSRSDPVQYLTCHIEGSFRKADRAGVFEDRVVQSGRRVRSRGNNPYASGNDIVFIGVVRPVVETFVSESRIEFFSMEYRTRHSIDGSIIQCEQRISLITGYMIHEVMGVNAMNFMHRDDVRWVIVALREMYVHHRLLGESYYRLMTKSGKFIYMKTSGCLEVDPVTKEATSFVCTNTEIPEADGIEQIRKMKKKFALKINNEELKDEDIPVSCKIDESQGLPVEDPRELERVIYHLVTDLPSPAEEDPKTNNKEPKSDLLIIPPQKEQIKTAILKSYSVITSLKKLKQDMTPDNLNDAGNNDKPDSETVNQEELFQPGPSNNMSVQAETSSNEPGTSEQRMEADSESDSDFLDFHIRNQPSEEMVSRMAESLLSEDNIIDQFSLPLTNGYIDFDLPGELNRYTEFLPACVDEEPSVAQDLEDLMNM